MGQHYSSPGLDTPAKFPVHPGEMIRTILGEMKHKDFAKKLKLPAPHFSNLINGQRHISATLAIKLEKHFDIPAVQWMAWQAEYDLSQVRKRKKVRRRLS